MSDRTNRRGFLHATALTGVGYWMAGGLPKRGKGGCFAAPAPNRKSPNERIALASIGIGGKGASDSDDAGKAGDMVAICDVDGHVLNAGEKRFPKAKRYTDYRKMLDEMGDSIDAVTVSTPDHNHAAAALMAMRMGKHCFCQKPLAHTIYEARLMAQTARDMNVATQMGNQGTAEDQLRRAAAVVQSGALGTVKEVHVWTNRPIWPQQGGNRPKAAKCPAHLDWNVWLGPAPARPYGNGYHPFAWRGWWDFGTGALGDMACHTVNMPYMALNLRDPIAVQAETSGHDGDGYPKWSIIQFDFPELGGRPAVKLFWYDGGKRPGKEIIGEMANLFKVDGDERHKGQPNRDLFARGCAVVGDKHTLLRRAITPKIPSPSAAAPPRPRSSGPNRRATSRSGFAPSAAASRPRPISPTIPAVCRKSFCWATWRFGPPPPARAGTSSGTPKT